MILSTKEALIYEVKRMANQAARMKRDSKKEKDIAMRGFMRGMSAAFQMSAKSLYQLVKEEL